MPYIIFCLYVGGVIKKGKNMKKYILSLFMFILLTQNLQAAEKDDYKGAFCRATFVATAVKAGAWLGENWAVDITTKIIRKNINSGPPFFNMTVGSSIRGRTLIDAIPIAAKKGAIVGAIAAGAMAPIIWDCSEPVAKSFLKIKNKLTEANISPEEEPNTTDYTVAGLTVTGGFLILYSIFK